MIGIPFDIPSLHKRGSYDEIDFSITGHFLASYKSEENAEFAINNMSESLISPCFYPVHTFFLNHTGKVLMCAHDWVMKKVLGSFNDQSFLDIWFGEEFGDVRSKLLSGNSNLSPCDVCNVKGTRMCKKSKILCNG